MPCDYERLPHPGIQSLQPYIPGKSVEELAKEQGLVDIIKLASNENPYGCSQLVTKALSNITSHDISTYTTAATHPLRKKLADRLAIDVSMLIFGNGSDALIPLLQTTFALHCDKHILTHEHAFISYSIYAKMLGIPFITTPLLANWQVDIETLIASCNQETALIFLANPNNPTGLMIPQIDISRLLKNIPETTIVVLDEAYYEYANGITTINSRALLAANPNLVILRTFSKAYGLAGLRLGYAIAGPSIGTILERALPPFTVNEAALIAGMAALDDEDFIEQTVKHNDQGLRQLQSGFNTMGLSHLPTSANFITFDCKTNSTELYQGLLQHGIIVRPLHAYGLDRFLRVSVGTPQQNNRFLDTLKELQHEQ